MNIQDNTSGFSPSDIWTILRRYNPWWSQQTFEVPLFRRTVFAPVWKWVLHPPAKRALLLHGPRQVGKTTLLLQMIQGLLQEGVPSSNILYATLDHPLLRSLSLDELLNLWREYEPMQPGPEYLFLDEIQHSPNWATWIKHQVDFFKQRRLIVTGSALGVEEESGVGRWHTIPVGTLSFGEFLQLRYPSITSLYHVSHWDELLGASTMTWRRIAESTQALMGYFHEYLLRGGFPQLVQVENLTEAQRLLREDILQKVLQRDLTALFGVRRVAELEQLFVYLCLHNGGLLDMGTLCNNLNLTKPTVTQLLKLLETAHLIFKLSPFGYGKEILRGRNKIYLTDPGMGPSILLQGKAMLERETWLGYAAEAAVVKHLRLAFEPQGAQLSYVRGSDDKEVDVVVSLPEQLLPFEVKYQDGAPQPSHWPGLRAFCQARKVSTAYVLTKHPNHVGDETLLHASGSTQCIKIPTAWACLTLSQPDLFS